MVVRPSGTVACPCASVGGRVTAQKLTANTAGLASSSRGQSTKANPQSRTPSGSGVMEVREEQPWKAPWPMETWRRGRQGGRRRRGRSSDGRLADGGEGRAPLEGIPADGDEAGGQDDGGEGCALPKGAPVDVDEIGREVDGGEGGQP